MSPISLRKPGLALWCAENCIRAGQVHGVRQSRFGFRRPGQDGNGRAGAVVAGMMCDCAVATGLLDDVRTCSGAASSFRERSGQGPEILVLRIRSGVLERQLRGKKVRFTPADRVLLAALLSRLRPQALGRMRCWYARHGAALAP